MLLGKLIFLCLSKEAELILYCLVLFRIPEVMPQSASLLMLWSDVWHYELWLGDDFKMMDEQCTMGKNDQNYGWLMMGSHGDPDMVNWPCAKPPSLILHSLEGLAF